MTRIRKSIPTAGMHEWWMLGWGYVMPDFDNKDRSIIEWVGAGTPLEPDSINRVPEASHEESADGDDRRQQPA